MLPEKTIPMLTSNLILMLLQILIGGPILILTMILIQMSMEILILILILIHLRSR